MKHYIPTSDYLPYAPSQPGEQVKVNHTNCPDGEDTRQRLYIKRCDDGVTILAYCHNCGGRGVHSDIRSVHITTATHRYSSRRSAGTKPIHYPNCAETDTTNWPPRARAWLYQYGITRGEINDYGIFYNPDNLRVGIPVFSRVGLGAIQYRRVFDAGQDDAPKYYTVAGADVPIYRSRNWASSDTVVLCEDALSTIKCGRILPAAALIGTHLKDGHVAELITCYSKFIIFLDDDNTQVRHQQLKLKNRLDVFGEAHIIHTSKDPKEYSEQELKEMLL